MLENALWTGGTRIVLFAVPTVVAGALTGYPVVAAGTAGMVAGAAMIGAAIRRAFYVAPRD